MPLTTNQILPQNLKTSTTLEEPKTLKVPTTTRGTYNYGFDSGVEPELILKNMNFLFNEKGTHPNSIIDRSHLDHTLAEKAILQMCSGYKENGFPVITIALSTHNPEADDFEKANVLANDNIFYSARVEQLKSDRESLLLQHFLRDNPDKEQTDFQMSEYDKNRINHVTRHDVIESFREELRLARQGAERSQTSPTRTSSDGGRLAAYRYGQDKGGNLINIDLLDNSKPVGEKATTELGTVIYEWGRPAPDYANSAKLYDVTLEDGTVCTVFLDLPSLIDGLHSIIKPDRDKSAVMDEVSQIAIDGLMKLPEPAGHTMLHAFNTTYADITLHADKLKEAGISHVLTSPPYTWRCDGPETQQDKQGQWYHAYQPEDLRFVENPHGNLQSYSEMITVLKARGIDVIADVALNFMGIGGDGGAGGDDKKGTLQYPSTDIRDERAASIQRGTGRIEGQTLLRTLKWDNKPIQQLPNMPFTSPDDFESSRNDVSNWGDLDNIRHNRLDGMPKVSFESSWILDAQRDYLQALKDLGVKGFRIDAEKHMTPEQLSHVLPPEITNNMFVFGETITPGGEDKAWRDYLEPRLKERTDIGAYDFPLQDRLLSAFKLGGDLQELRITGEYSPSPILASQSVTFSVNHDIPNNGGIFGHMLFGHPDDEKLANAYILSLPGKMPLIYSDGGAQLSITEVPREGAPSLGGDAWTTGWQSMSSMIEFHNKLHNQSGMWFAYEGDLASPTCLAFSRGDGPVEENGSGHSALVIINKADKEISPVSWPNPLKPGRYRDYGPGDKGVFIVGDDGRFLPESNLKIEGRTALMLALQESESINNH